MTEFLAPLYLGFPGSLFMTFSYLSFLTHLFLLVPSLQGCCDEMLHNLSELGLITPRFHVKTGPNMQTAITVAL